MEYQEYPEVKHNSNKKKKLSKGTKVTIAIFVIFLLIIIGSIISQYNKSPTVADQSVKKSTKSTSSKSDNLTITDPSTATTSPSTSGSSTSTTAPATTTPAQTAPSISSCSPVSDAASMEGSTGCIQFTGYAYTSSRGEMYLDQYSSAPYGFSAYIPAGTSFGPSLISQYSGQPVDVTGTITTYDGEPEIIVTNSSQIQPAQ